MLVIFTYNDMNYIMFTKMTQHCYSLTVYKALLAR